jgi:hypothetical protein
MQKVDCAYADAEEKQGFGEFEDGDGDQSAIMDSACLPFVGDDFGGGWIGLGAAHRVYP